MEQEIIPSRQDLYPSAGVLIYIKCFLQTVGIDRLDRKDDIETWHIKTIPISCILNTQT